MTPGREWDAVALAVAIVGVMSGLAIAMALSLSGCAAAGHGASDAVGPVADRPLEPIPTQSCQSGESLPTTVDGGVVNIAVTCAEVSAGESSACGAGPAAGYVGCCCHFGRESIMTVAFIPGGPADPCVAPEAPGYGPTPNCISVPNQNLNGVSGYDVAAAKVCGPGGTYNDGRGPDNRSACCCY